MKPHIYVMPEAFMADQSVPAHWRILGICNGFFANHKDVYASNEWFQGQLGCSRPTVSDGIAKLESLGLVTVERTKNSRLIKRGEASQLAGGGKLKPISHANQLAPNSDSNSVSLLGADAAQVVEVKDETSRPVRKDTEYLDVFALFGKYPLNWKRNRTEIDAAKNLLEEHGLEKAKIALDFKAKFGSDPHFPQILKPSDLDRKWLNLLAYRDRV